MKVHPNAQRTAMSPSAYVAFVAFAVLCLKFVLLLSLESGIWINGDGSLRLSEISNMTRFGLTVPGVNAATAGYATVVHIVGVAIGTTSLWPIALIQSVFLSIAVWFLAVSLMRTRLAWAGVPFAYIALLNPPLSLSSLALSSDSVTAGLLMVALGHLIRDLATPRDVRTPRRILTAAAVLSLAALMSPMLAFGSVAFLLAWAAARGNREQAIWISAGALALLLALPLMLLVRNQMANNSSMLATSSEQMAPVVSGFAGLDSTRCGIGTLDVVSLNVPKFRCLMAWYQESSSNATEAAVPNAVSFWSPWVGPMSGIDLRDNPWPALHPAAVLGDPGNPDSIVNSPLATLVSWMWLLFALFGMLLGLGALRGLGEVESEISVAAGWLIFGSWLASTLTHADASTRLPVMGMVILLQVVGWRFLFTRGRETSRDPFAPQ